MLSSSPDSNGNFAGRNDIVFLLKRATTGSYFEALKTNHFDKKLQWIAGIAFENN